MEKPVNFKKNQFFEKFRYVSQKDLQQSKIFKIKKEAGFLFINRYFQEVFCTKSNFLFGKFKTCTLSKKAFRYVRPKASEKADVVQEIAKKYRKNLKKSKMFAFDYYRFASFCLKKSWLRQENCKQSSFKKLTPN